MIIDFYLVLISFKGYYFSLVREMDFCFVIKFYYVIVFGFKFVLKYLDLYLECKKYGGRGECYFVW